MRKDRGADGRAEAFPAFIDTAKETKRAFEERDGAFNTSAKALCIPESRSVFTLNLLLAATAFLCNGNSLDFRLERLDVRYAARPGFSQKRLSLSPSGKVVYKLRRRYYTGQTEVVLE